MMTEQSDDMSGKKKPPKKDTDVGNEVESFVVRPIFIAMF